MTQPEDFVFDTIVCRYSAVTVGVSGTMPAAGTVLFELISPRHLAVDGVEVTVEPVVGYISEDGTMRRESRSGEEGVPLLTSTEFGDTPFTYRATFNLTDGTGRAQLNKSPKKFRVTDEDVDLGGL
ncbi:hypothetical protein AB4Z39_10825 [Mycobacterium adipatum]|uniref:hypothetical protein n=1 Tax=Mycobacterium adipatum TaxID=1682113 RepID=UPI0034E0D3D5